MRKFFGSVLFTGMFLAPFAAKAQIHNDISMESMSRAKKPSAWKKAASRFSFNYYAKYLGPSLSGQLQNGATFNRFETGVNQTTRKELDYIGSEQVYQSFRLGYQLPKGMILSYGVTFQDNLREDIEYTYTNWNDEKTVYTREKGRSNNNHRASLWIPNLYSNNSLFVGASLYYELPTTDASQAADMRYGAGIQPSVGFYSKTPGLFYGIGFSIERDFYKTNYQMPSWCSEPGYTCEGVYPIVNRQVFRASVSPYLNYMLSDKVTLLSSLSLDWDQLADQLGTTELNSNMDDIANLAVSYSFNNNLRVSTGVEASISHPDLKRTALYAALAVSI